MIHGRDIIYISSIEWNFLWQGHQEIALRLAAAGNRVLYVENTGVRSPGWRDARRIVARARRWARGGPLAGRARSWRRTYTSRRPSSCPPSAAPGDALLNRRLFLPPLLAAARRLGMREPLVWTYLPNDTTLDLIHMLGTERAGLVYYCVADFSQLTPHPRRLEAAEREIVETADVVFTSCSELKGKFAPHNAHTYIYPFGVNLDAFPFEARPRVELNGSNGERRRVADARARLACLRRLAPAPRHRLRRRHAPVRRFRTHQGDGAAPPRVVLGLCGGLAGGHGRAWPGCRTST